MKIERIKIRLKIGKSVWNERIVPVKKDMSESIKCPRISMSKIGKEKMPRNDKNHQELENMRGKRKMSMNNDKFKKEKKSPEMKKDQNWKIMWKCKTIRSKCKKKCL